MSIRKIDVICTGCGKTVLSKDAKFKPWPEAGRGMYLLIHKCANKLPDSCLVKKGADGVWRTSKRLKTV